MASAAQLLFDGTADHQRVRPGGQLLKWVGNKFRYAEEIARALPSDLGTYYEPFVGTGAVLATLAPHRAVAGDALAVLIEFLQEVQSDPSVLVEHYGITREDIVARGRPAYEEVKERFNTEASPGDLLVLSRTCYGGVMRFTRQGSISTPMGPHRPMSADKLSTYMSEWSERLRDVEFAAQDYRTTIAAAGAGDTVYCDPPYRHGQAILYGAQDFQLPDLLASICDAIERGARVALSIDGWRQSGAKPIELGIPANLFKRELLIERGGCMLRRFQKGGENMALEQVADRLLLSW